MTQLGDYFDQSKALQPWDTTDICGWYEKEDLPKNCTIYNAGLDYIDKWDDFIKQVFKRYSFPEEPYAVYFETYADNHPYLVIYDLQSEVMRVTLG